MTEMSKTCGNDADEADICPWEGEVEVDVYHGQERWKCPLCGHDHQDEAQGPDPDDAYDTMRDLRDGIG